MSDTEMREWIDNANYESLLSRWRNAPAGSPWFQGEIGKYYSDVMAKMRAQTSSEEQVRASKSIGWD